MCLQIKKQEQPTLPQLIKFPGAEDLNVMTEIGTQYRMFGTLLLNDENGAIVKAIEQQHQNRATDINYEIFQQWIQGSGIQPVTWETLVKVLKQTQLRALANKIESSMS